MNLGLILTPNFKWTKPPWQLQMHVNINRGVVEVVDVVLGLDRLVIAAFLVPLASLDLLI